MKECHTKNCVNGSVYLFTWPGRDQAGFCEPCKVRAERIADAMGLHVQFIPVCYSCNAGDPEPLRKCPGSVELHGENAEIEPCNCCKTCMQRCLDDV